MSSLIKNLAELAKAIEDEGARFQFPDGSALIIKHEAEGEEPEETPSESKRMHALGDVFTSGIRDAIEEAEESAEDGKEGVELSRLNLKIPKKLKEYLTIAAKKASIEQRRNISLTQYLCGLVIADMKRNGEPKAGKQEKREPYVMDEPEFLMWLALMYGCDRILGDEGEE